MGSYDAIVLLGMAIEIYFAEYKDDLQLRYILKPIPIFLLIVHLSNYKTKMARLTTIGLIFSVVGDIMLSLEGEENFLIGTVFFFLAHVLYIFALRVPSKGSQTDKSLNPVVYLLCLLVYSVAGNSFYKMWDNMNHKILFVPYGLILSTMVCCSLLRSNITTVSSYWSCLLGSILFAVSDNLLAFFKFNFGKSLLGSILVMATYYLAQYFIMKGAIYH